MALAFLTSIPKEPPIGLVLDDSVYYWTEASKLLLDLLSRGRYIPALTRSEGRHQSHWQILTTEDNDTKRMAVLVDCMPPICRAMISDNDGNPSAPNAIFESFIAKGANSLIRSFLRNEDLSAEIDNYRKTPRTEVIQSG